MSSFDVENIDIILDFKTTILVFIQQPVVELSRVLLSNIKLSKRNVFFCDYIFGSVIVKVRKNVLLLKYFLLWKASHTCIRYCITCNFLICLFLAISWTNI